MSDTLDELRRVWYEAQAIPSDAELKAGLGEILGGNEPLVAKPQALPRDRQIKRSFVFRPRWVAYIAAVAVVVAFGVIEYLPGWQNHTSQKAQQAYDTHAGQRAAITLSDGTRVIMNAATTMAFMQDKAGGRIVNLQGEAIFTIAHSERESFTVIAGGARTTVLGTTFGVRKYPSDTVVRVAVVDGKVRVNDNALLTAHDVATISSGNQTLITRNVDISELLEWNKGRITFRNTSLGDASAELSRTYGVTVIVRDPALADAKVRLTASTNEDVRGVLDAIAQVLGGAVIQNGSVFEIVSTSKFGR